MNVKEREQYQKVVKKYFDCFMMGQMINLELLKKEEIIIDGHAFKYCNELFDYLLSEYSDAIMKFNKLFPAIENYKISKGGYTLLSIADDLFEGKLNK